MTPSNAPLQLENSTLLIDAGYVAGEWVRKSQSNKTFEVLNPSTGTVLATLPDMGRGEVKAAIDAAHTNFRTT